MIYNLDDIEDVKVTQKTPTNLREKLALFSIKVVRSSFDFISRYDEEKMTEKKWINRVIFLETVAGVPGMVGGMARHLRSLRLMQRDNGWIHHLLEEADNERFHLFTFLTLKNPGIMFRAGVIITQTIFFNFFMLSYLLSSRFSHCFVGYLEE
jgi:hypothetical protein